VTIEDLLAHYHALENVDARSFQPRARLLQSIWRDEQGFESTTYRGKIRGARLPMPWATDTLTNYLHHENKVPRRSRSGATICLQARCSLAASMDDGGEFDDGFFVFLAPEGNEYCREAVADYRECLTDEETFESWTLEGVVEALREHSSAAWVELFWDRYLAWSKIDEVLAKMKIEPVD
jgi:hypothetical protein